MPPRRVGLRKERANGARFFAPEASRTSARPAVPPRAGLGRTEVVFASNCAVEGFSNTPATPRVYAKKRAGASSRVAPREVRVAPAP